MGIVREYRRLSSDINVIKVTEENMEDALEILESHCQDPAKTFELEVIRGNVRAIRCSQNGKSIWIAKARDVITLEKNDNFFKWHPAIFDHCHVASLPG